MQLSSTAATSANALLPLRWPWVSTTRLKLSISKKISEKVVPWRRPSSTSFSKER